MENKQNVSMCTFYAVSPIHAGSVASTSVVDLPIQRERHTQWPHIQSSAVKGALRAHYRRFAAGETAGLINLIFGSDEGNDGIKEKDNNNNNIPGAIAVTDAKLLAMPVRSNIAPFVWVTCPAVVQRFMRDMTFLGENLNWDIPRVTEDDAIVLKGDIAGKVILEEAVVDIKGGRKDSPFERFSELERLLLVSDDMYDYVVTSCTEVQTQIKIEAQSGTTKEGSLRYEELLPSDSLLYSLIYFAPRHTEQLNHFKEKTIQEHLVSVIKDFTQIGGDETLGRGICRVKWLKGGE